MKQKKIIIEFLSTLGVQKIDWNQESESHFSGRAFFDTNDFDDFQDFKWEFQKDIEPKYELINLLKLIKKKKLIDIDKITISIDKLRKLFNTTYEMKLSSKEFDLIIEELIRIKIPMVDSAETTDSFCIHF